MNAVLLFLAHEHDSERILAEENENTCGEDFLNENELEKLILFVIISCFYVH